MDISHPTHHHVQRVSFHLLTPDQIRRLSVRQLTSQEIFDQLGHPVRGGLYDPALGPIDKNGRCATCGLGFFQCPGHFGHVQLAVPVYAPLTFAQMFQLLRQTCLYCHRLRQGPLKVRFHFGKPYHRITHSLTHSLTPSFTSIDTLMLEQATIT